MIEVRGYKVAIEQDEDGAYIATIPMLPGVVEQGDTPEEARQRLAVALDFTLDCMAKEKGDVA